MYNLLIKSEDKTIGKLKQFFKLDYKTLIIGIVIGLTIAGTSAYAITVASNTITYDNTNSGLTSTNVQNAIDEVYTKANSCNISLKELGNSNIVSVKKYDETSNSSTYCVTGNESTCQSLTPAKTGTYEKGTIIDYKVNNNTTRRFHVLHDDGTKLTLQDQKNIVDNVAYVTKEDYIAAGGTESEWNSCTYNAKYHGCNDRGPLTILPALESATTGWTNVNLQTYTLGTTSFLGNNKTGCTMSACGENTYTMAERSGRSRLITEPESEYTGCVNWKNRTCPKYMYNYLNDADSYGAEVDGGEASQAYWTVSARSDFRPSAWMIRKDGYISWDELVVTYSGARAVVEINK